MAFLPADTAIPARFFTPLLDRNLRNLRSGCLTHLTVNDQQARKKEHDMRALKRLEMPGI